MQRGRRMRKKILQTVVDEKEYKLIRELYLLKYNAGKCNSMSDFLRKMVLDLANSHGIKSQDDKLDGEQHNNVISLDQVKRERFIFPDFDFGQDF